MTLQHSLLSWLCNFRLAPSTQGHKPRVGLACMPFAFLRGEICPQEAKGGYRAAALRTGVLLLTQCIHAHANENEEAHRKDAHAGIEAAGQRHAIRPDDVDNKTPRDAHRNQPQGNNEANLE